MHAMSVSIPRSISTNEAVVATASDVFDHVKATDGLETGLRCSISSGKWKAQYSVYNIHDAQNNKQRCGSVEECNSAADTFIHSLLWDTLKATLDDNVVSSHCVQRTKTIVNSLRDHRVNTD